MKIESALFAGGSFWSLQEAFDVLDGICFSVVGYMGGLGAYPSYEDVMQGDTGHVQTLKLVYNKNIVSYKDLVEHFFSIHNPTGFNRQGPDVGDPFRSVIFYQTEEQKKTAQKAKENFNKHNRYQMDATTQILKASVFYPAEDRHQNFFEKRQSYFGLN